LFVLGALETYATSSKYSCLCAVFRASWRLVPVFSGEEERLMQKKEGSFVLRVPLLQHQH
jgi:hypothetical protein